jgi:GMP synthase (glutamine-hydrolysing)
LEKSKQIDGMIILGSNSNVSDRLKWQQDLALFTIDKLKKDIPVLGVCFGHQLISDTFGSTIGYVTKDQQKFSGRRDITFIKDFKKCFSKGESVSIGYAHQQEIKTLSNELIHLATSKICKYEVVAHKTLPFLGTQGHPEADIEFMETNMSPLPSEEDRKIVFEGGTKFLDCFFEYFHRG